MKQESWQETIKRLRENKKRNEQNYELMRRLHNERVQRIKEIEEGQAKAAKDLRGKLAKASI